MTIRRKAPTIALQQCELLTRKMAVRTVEGFRLALQTLNAYDEAAAGKVRGTEGDIDHYEDVLGTYLTKIARAQISDDDSSRVSELLKVIGDLERISDHSVNVLESVEELREKKIEFSDSAKKEMGVLCDALAEILDNTLEAFCNSDVVRAASVEPLEQVIDGLKATLRDRHIVRLKDGECTVEAGFIWSDLLTNLERASDHCSNIALCIIDADSHNMNAHEAIRSLKHNNPSYLESYASYARKYNISG